MWAQAGAGVFSAQNFPPFVSLPVQSGRKAFYCIVTQIISRPTSGFLERIKAHGLF